MRIYTKLGDTGETGLLYGGRLPKDDPRAEAYGTVDEAVSVLGLARATCSDPHVLTVIESLQRELFIVAAELATEPTERSKLEKHFSVLTPDMTSSLERSIDYIDKQIQLPKSFIVPGATAGSAAIDVARSVLRRAERRTVTLQNNGSLGNEEVLRYLNRASDLLFMLARYEDRTKPFERVNDSDREPTG